MEKDDEFLLIKKTTVAAYIEEMTDVTYGSSFFRRNEEGFGSLIFNEVGTSKNGKTTVALIKKYRWDFGVDPIVETIDNSVLQMFQNPWQLFHLKHYISTDIKYETTTANNTGWAAWTLPRNNTRGQLLEHHFNWQGYTGTVGSAVSSEPQQIFNNGPIQNQYTSDIIYCNQLITVPFIQTVQEVTSLLINSLQGSATVNYQAAYALTVWYKYIEIPTLEYRRLKAMQVQMVTAPSAVARKTTNFDYL